MKINIRIIALLVFLFGGCSTEPSQESPAEIVPLTIGNTWIYQSKMYDSSDAMIDQWIDTTRIIGDSTINGEKWFWFNWNFYVSSSTYLIKNTPTGYCQFDRNLLINAPVLNYKYPAKSGDVYNVIFQFKDSIWSFQRTVVTVDTEVIVPSASYSCLLYYNPRVPLTSATEVTEQEYFIATGTGIVKENRFRTSFSGRRYLWSATELTKAILK